jgi:hypothetical protein
MKFYQIHKSAFPRPISFEVLSKHDQKKYGMGNLRTRWELQKMVAAGRSLNDAADEIGIPVNVVKRYFANHPKEREQLSFLLEWKERSLKRLVRFIEARNGAVRVRDVMQSYAPFKNQKSKAEQALAALVGAGLGDWVETKPNGRGRPTREFRLLTASAPELCRYNSSRPRS